MYMKYLKSAKDVIVLLNWIVAIQGSLVGWVVSHVSSFLAAPSRGLIRGLRFSDRGIIVNRTAAAAIADKPQPSCSQSETLNPGV